VTDDPHEIGSLRSRPKKEEPKPDEPKTKDECLAVIWGTTQGDPDAYREAAIWYTLSAREADRARSAINECTGERKKQATGPDRDPWRGTEKAVLELERRGINGLAAIVRRYLAGETPSPEAQAELEHLKDVLGPS
jgi:hypothetical protein